MFCRTVPRWVYIPGAAGVPPAIEALTPLRVGGGRAMDTVCQLDWEDGPTATYLGYSCELYHRKDLALRGGFTRRLTQLIDNLHARGCHIGPMTSSRVVTLYGNYGAIDTTLRFFESAVVRCGAHPHLYTAMAAFYARLGNLTKTKEMLRFVADNGGAASIHQYHAVLQCFAVKKSEAAAFRLIETLAKTSIVPEPRTVQLLFKCCRSYATGRVVMQSLQDGKWAVNPTIVVDLLMYHGLIKSCVHRGEVRSAFAVLEEMKKDPDIDPDIRTYNTLASVCRSAGDMKAVADCVLQARRAGLPPDQIMYTILLGAVDDRLRVVPHAERAKWMGVAEAAFEQGFADGVVDSNLHFTGMARCYASVGDVAGMAALKARLVSEGFSAYEAFTVLEVECEKKTRRFAAAWVPMDETLPVHYVACGSREGRTAPSEGTNKDLPKVLQVADPADTNAYLSSVTTGMPGVAAEAVAAATPAREVADGAEKTTARTHPTPRTRSGGWTRGADAEASASSSRKRPIHEQDWFVLLSEGFEEGKKVGDDTCGSQQAGDAATAL